jgi:hypothetical protein
MPQSCRQLIIYREKLPVAKAITSSAIGNIISGKGEILD